MSPAAAPQHRPPGQGHKTLLACWGWWGTLRAVHTIVFIALGALLAGAQSSLLPLAAMFYPSVCRAVGVSWMHGIGRVGAILGAFFGSLIFTFNLSLAAIFYVLAIPTLISCLALWLKGRNERHEKAAAVTESVRLGS